MLLTSQSRHKSGMSLQNIPQSGSLSGKSFAELSNAANTEEDRRFLCAQPQAPHGYLESLKEEASSPEIAREGRPNDQAPALVPVFGQHQQVA